MSRLAHNAFGLPRGVLGRIAGWIMSRGNADMERAIVDALPLSPDTHVLEVGFGPGVGLRLLAERCPAGRVAGADPSPVMVRQARRRVPSGVELVEAGVSDLPWPDGTFDAVVSCNNIMLWPDLPADLREVTRVLRPGGWLGIAVHAWALRKSTWPDAVTDAELLDRLTARLGAAGLAVQRRQAAPRGRHVALYVTATRDPVPGAVPG